MTAPDFCVGIKGGPLTQLQDGRWVSLPPCLGVGSRDGDVAKIFHMGGWTSHFSGCFHHPIVLETEVGAAGVMVCW